LLLIMALWRSFFRTNKTQSHEPQKDTVTLVTKDTVTLTTRECCTNFNKYEREKSKKNKIRGKEILILKSEDTYSHGGLCSSDSLHIVHPIRYN
jgi:hypothetical protein